MHTTLNTPLSIGSLEIRNRLYRAPLLEGAGTSKNPAQHLLKQFLPNAESGVGLIVMGTSVIFPQGRPSPGMIGIDTADELLQLKPMTEAVTQAGSGIVLQLGHGGLYCMETWHSELRKTTGYVAPVVSQPTLRARMLSGFAPYRVLEMADIRDFSKRFGLVAAWAREAGFSAVQLSASNGKFLHQFLSRIHNTRSDRYGGSLDRRFQFFREIRDQIALHAGEDFPVMLKYPAMEVNEFGTGITLDDGLQFAVCAEAAGFSAVTPVIAHSYINSATARGGAGHETFDNPRSLERIEKAMGGPRKVKAFKTMMQVAAKRYPFSSVWNREVFSAVKSALTIPVFAVGGIRTRTEMDSILGNEHADMVGVGRPFYAQPELARDLLSETASQDLDILCENCNACIITQLLGSTGACVNPSVHQKRRKMKQQMAV